MSDEVKIEDVVADDSKTVEEPSITMVDVLQQEKELEEESAAVLGGSDDKCCTYTRGHIKRQALYSCLTCCPDARDDPTKRNGICLACSYHCHEHHELIELYTKRKFRCDCPTSRIPGNKCTLTESTGDEKCESNSENSYNQNFSGVYCTCKRPYPDPEDQIPDEMIQCVICEDWYHMRHLKTSAPAPEACSEMTCDGCMETCSFLKDYAGMAVNKVESTSENGNVSILNCTTDEEKLRADLDKSISDIMPNISANDDQVDDVPAANGTDPSDSEPPAPKKAKLDENSETCTRPTNTSTGNVTAVFWADNWRASLCCCKTCKQLYEKHNVSFLLDPEDTVQFYEENGLKNVRESDEDRAMRALSTLDRTQQIDVIVEYNNMKNKLMEYLHPFANSQRVVTSQDIKQFFETMKNEKNENIGQPFFCR